jgi:Ni/Co efflux regulator RcnB
MIWFLIIIIVVPLVCMVLAEAQHEARQEEKRRDCERRDWERWRKLNARSTPGTKA